MTEKKGDSQISPKKSEKGAKETSNLDELQRWGGGGGGGVGGGGWGVSSRQRRSKCRNRGEKTRTPGTLAGRTWRKEGGLRAGGRSRNGASGLEARRPGRGTSGGGSKVSRRVSVPWMGWGGSPVLSLSAWWKGKRQSGWKRKTKNRPTL